MPKEDAIIAYAPAFRIIDERLVDKGLGALTEEQKCIIGLECDKHVAWIVENEDYVGKKVSGLDLRHEILKFTLPDMMYTRALELKGCVDQWHWYLRCNDEVPIYQKCLDAKEFWGVYQDGMLRVAYDRKDFAESFYKSRIKEQSADCTCEKPPAGSITVCNNCGHMMPGAERHIYEVFHFDLDKEKIL